MHTIIPIKYHAEKLLGKYNNILLQLIIIITIIYNRYSIK